MSDNESWRLRKSLEEERGEDVEQLEKRIAELEEALLRGKERAEYSYLHIAELKERIAELEQESLGLQGLMSQSCAVSKMGRLHDLCANRYARIAELEEAARSLLLILDEHASASFGDAEDKLREVLGDVV